MSIEDIFNNFKNNYRNIVNNIDVDDMQQSPARQETVTARSGGNINFSGNTALGTEFKDTLQNAIKFYQDEFKVTPRATITHDMLMPILGATWEATDKSGQYPVYLRNLDKKRGTSAKYMAEKSAAEGWSPKNSGDLAWVPTHELGHVLTYMLFPSENGSDSDDVRKLYVDALKDTGVDTSKNWEDINKQAYEKVKAISGYAANTGEYGLRGPLKEKRVFEIPDTYEVVAEALADYYYNRNKAADLSRAIVKRLKSKGSMYGLTQSGGVDTSASPENFVKNLRRYSAIQ